ncbi:MAG TPA: DUF1592 domain-containing protein [Opitutaceae bacterium]|nr:DUF1592 domain-containing protein [Opitutaceae bacterium]
MSPSRAFSIVVVAALAVSLRGAGAEPAVARVSYEKDVTPLLEKYCYECHGNGRSKGDVALDTFKTVADVDKDHATWETVLHHVRSHEMPPEDADVQPTQAERDVIGDWIEKQLFKFDPKNPDPGRVTIRRLNRAEYNNTIRDLVGVDFKPAADFPPDDSGYGFDNIGDVLSLPPVLMEKYLAAADKILDQAIVTDPIESKVQRYPASLAQVGFNAIGDRGDGWVQLISLEEDDVAVEVPTLAAGDYLVRVHAFAKPTGGAMVGGGNNNTEDVKGKPDPTKISIMVNDAFIKDFELSTDEANPGTYEARVGLPAGRPRVRAEVRRIHGGDNELFMLNGRLGKQQPGIAFVKWIEVEGPLPAATRRYRADQLAATGEGRFTPAGERVLEKNGDVSTTINVTKEGDYILRAQAYAKQAGSETTRMQFQVDGKPVKDFDVIAMANMEPLPSQRVFSVTLLIPQPYVYEVRTHLTPGQKKFSAAFVNEFADPKNENPNLRVRNLIVQNLEVVDLSAPVITPAKPAPVEELFAKYTAPKKPGLLGRVFGQTARPAQNAAAARAIVTDFTRRAWRHPADPAEIDRLMGLYDLAEKHGDGFDASVKLAMKAVLVSPHFLFVGEPPASAATANAVQPLDEFTLASRLSYFLWSSTPDDELLGLAEHGQLRQNLEAQVRRMLASPKAHALVDNFAGQWLQIRSLDTAQPDKSLFPDYDLGLRTAMQKETELFFENVMRQDRPVFDFLTADYTFVNGRLAKFYGLPGVTGEDFQKVSLADTPRRGVLTQASVLTLTSNPTRTSPVKRGKWVLENLLGTPPPPPPPNVPDLDDKGRKLTGTLRQQMEQHRENPNCASCHARMDPIGFGLENFDAIGAWRDKDGEAAIDPAGKLTSGDTFGGAAELTKLLATKRRAEFLHCLAEKMLTYALGRGVEYYDRPALDSIVKGLEADQFKFSGLVLETVKSFPFEMRRGENPPGEVASAPAPEAPAVLAPFSIPAQTRAARVTTQSGTVASQTESPVANGAR